MTIGFGQIFRLVIVNPIRFDQGVTTPDLHLPLHLNIQVAAPADFLRIDIGWELLPLRLAGVDIECIAWFELEACGVLILSFVAGLSLLLQAV